jgi:hypothetical protein
MPLVSIDGLVCLTDERIYMQPLHATILGKPVVNLKIKNIKELFKRRYTLMDLGIEIISHSQSDDEAQGLKKKVMYLVFTTKQERDTVYNALR